jgi:FSR family fosmidomycin resistance protein-like MFS transporter
MKQSSKFQYKNVLSVSIAHYIHDVYSVFLSPIIPLLIEKLSINYSLAGVLTFSQRFPSLLNPLIGMFIDRWKIRYFVIFTPAITSICMSFLGLAPSFIFAVVLMLLMGVSSAFFHVPAPVMIKSFSGERTGRGMSFYMVGGELARTTGPIIVLGAISLWGLEGTYRLIPFGLAASFFLFIRFRKIDIRPDEKPSHDFSAFKRTFQKHLHFFILIAGIMFFRAFMKTSILFFLPAYLKEQGESLWFGGMSLSIFEIAGAAGTFLAGNISDRLGRINTLLVVTIATPLLMLLFVFAHGFWVLPVLVIMGFFMLATAPVVLAFVMDRATEHHSFMNGIYMTIVFVSGSISALVVGGMGDWIGLVNTYRVSALLAFLAIPFVIVLSGRRRRLSERDTK